MNSLNNLFVDFLCLYYLGHLFPFIQREGNSRLYCVFLCYPIVFILYILIAFWGIMAYLPRMIRTVSETGKINI